MKRRPMCVVFAALVLALTAVIARDSARASALEPGTGFTVGTGAAAGAVPALRAPMLVVTTPGLDEFASHFEPKGSGPPPPPPISEARYQPRMPPNHPPIGPVPTGPPVPSESRYQPRLPVDHPPIAARKPYPRGFGQIHSGFMDPEGSLGPAYLLGFRAGTQINPMMQLGLGVDWRHKSGTDAQVIQEGVGPGGEPVVLYRDLSHYSSDLVPGMVYLQLSLPASLAIVPYVGAGAGWQWLFLSADDYQTPTTFDATYDGFGWQLWAGAGIRLFGTRLFGEAFYNEVDLSRNVYDYGVDANFRETIHDEGVGARFGLNWGF